MFAGKEKGRLIIGKVKFLLVVVVYILILSVVSAFSYGVINIRLAQICRHVFNSDFGEHLSFVSLHTTDILIFGLVIFLSGLVYWLSLKQVWLGLIGYMLLRLFLMLDCGMIKGLGIQIVLDIIVFLVLLCVSKWLFQMGRVVRVRLLPKKVK